MYNFIRKCFIGMFGVLWLVAIIGMTFGGVEAMITGSSNLLDNCVTGALALGLTTSLLWLFDGMISDNIH